MGGGRSGGGPAAEGNGNGAAAWRGAPDGSSDGACFAQRDGAHGQRSGGGESGGWSAANQEADDTGGVSYHRAAPYDSGVLLEGAQWVPAALQVRCCAIRCDDEMHRRPPDVNGGCSPLHDAARCSRATSECGLRGGTPRGRAQGVSCRSHRTTQAQLITRAIALVIHYTKNLRL